MGNLDYLFKTRKNGETNVPTFPRQQNLHSQIYKVPTLKTEDTVPSSAGHHPAPCSVVLKGSLSPVMSFDPCRWPQSRTQLSEKGQEERNERGLSQHRCHNPFGCL